MFKKILIDFTFHTLLLYFDHIISDTKSEEAINIIKVLDDIRKRLNP